MTILIDIDSTIADILTPWLKSYNNKYKDNLKPKDIVDWNVHIFTKPECGEKIYDFIKNPKLYNRVKPIPGALEAITALRDMGLRIVFVTHFEPGFSYAKFDWLKRYGFMTDDNDYVETRDKNLIKGSCLIDDNIDNVTQFSELGILYSTFQNKKYNYKYRLNSWSDIVKIIEDNFS